MKTLKIKWDSYDNEYKLYDNGAYVGMLCRYAHSWVGGLNEIKIAAKNPKKKGWFRVDCVPAVKTTIKGQEVGSLGSNLRKYLQAFCGIKVEPCNEYSFYAKFD